MAAPAYLSAFPAAVAPLCRIWSDASASDISLSDPHLARPFGESRLHYLTLLKSAFSALNRHIMKRTAHFTTGKKSRGSVAIALGLATSGILLLRRNRQASCPASSRLIPLHPGSPRLTSIYECILPEKSHATGA